MQHYQILRALLSTVIFTTALTTALHAQERGPITEGTNFVVAYMNLMNQAVEQPLPNPLQLYITTQDTCTVHLNSIGVDSFRIDQTFTVIPDSVTRIPIPSPHYLTREHGKVVGGGIWIRSTAPISVASAILWRGNSELLRHLPTTSWGTRYRTFNLYQDRYGNAAGYKYRPAQIVLISGADSTIVELRTKYALKTGGPDVDSIGPLTYRVHMNAYQRVYLEWAIDEDLTKDLASDPTGTLITSNEPIAVLSGHTKGAVMRYPDVLPPTGMFAAEAHFVRNCIQDVMLPETLAGTEYLTVPIRYAMRKTGDWSTEYGVDDDRGDVIRFIALEDNTVLSVHRQDGTGFTTVASLDEGEVHTGNVVENASFWRSSKPVLCMQYGKSWANILPNKKNDRSGDILGHPTVESGLPMMQAVPSVDRWIDRGSFHSQDGVDNFISIAFRTADAGAILLDGESLSSRYGQEIRNVAGTEFSSARIPVAAGDHAILTTRSDVRFMAWSYGSFEGMKQGRTYGAPLGIDLIEPCTDTLEIEEDQAVTDCANGVFAAAVSVRSGVEDCGRIQSISLTQSHNMTFDNVPVTGSSSSSYVVRAISKSLRASGTVRILTTAGTYKEIRYNHQPATDSVSEVSVNFGTVLVNEQHCTTLTVTNVSFDDTLVIAEILAKPTQRVFTVSPTQAVLGPRDSLTVTVCARPEVAATVVDTIYMRLTCELEPLVECTVVGNVPLSMVYPQPLILTEHEGLNISAKGAVNAISVVDPIGKLIGTYVPDGPIRIPSSMFPAAGMYVLSLETSEGVTHIPVVCIE